MNKYRFKTQDEFIRDGQWDDNNHCPLGWSLSGDMNHYLGQDVPEEANENCDLGEGFEDDGWEFESTNYVLKKEDYTGRWIKALVDNPSCTGVRLGEVIKIIGNSGVYILDRTASGISGMAIPHPLQTSEWELLEQPKHDTKLSSFPTSGAILIDECDNLKEFKRYLFESPRTCNEAAGNPKYLAWNNTSFWYPSTTGKTMYKWNQLKHFIPTKKDDSDDILEKARRLYPIGTEFICNLGSFGGGTQTVQAELSWYDDKKESITHSGIGWVYFNGKWAEIVKPAPSKDVPGYVRCVQALMNAKVGTVYPVVDEKHCLCEDGNTYVWDSREFTSATKQEYDAQFSDEQDPLYICKQKYRKGMKVRSASKTGVYAGEFIIDVDPKEFRYLSGNIEIVDYSCSKGYLYYKGEYAEILEEGIYDISEIIETNKPSVDDYLVNSGFAKSNPEAYNWLMDKPKPSIEPVHSVDVNLRTKKQINKFKF